MDLKALRAEIGDRAYNGLRRGGYDNVAAVRAASTIPNFGRVSLVRVRAALSPSPDPPPPARPPAPPRVPAPRLRRTGRRARRKAPTGLTIRCLINRPAAPVDWLTYAEQVGITILFGEEARADCREEFWSTDEPLKVGDDPEHGLYWKYVGRAQCRCDDCRESWRRYRRRRA